MPRDCRTRHRRCLCVPIILPTALTSRVALLAVRRMSASSSVTLRCAERRSFHGSIGWPLRRCGHPPAMHTGRWWVPAYRDGVLCGYRRRVHCPRCGRPMTGGPRTAVCREGAMELSEVMHEALRASFSSEPVRAAASSERWGGDWHCPADGTRTHESRGQVHCLACGRDLPRSILYQLIEFHVHRAVGVDTGELVTSIENRTHLMR
jgi:uncharacterized Zn finger protein (UPF0148 family)